MYEETKSSIDWKGLFLKVIIAFLILFIAFKGYSLLKGNKVNDKKETTTSATSNSASSTTFATNMEKLRTAGNSYFIGDKLPTSSAPTIVTLNELINNGLIDSLVDEDGKTCDGESSYVTAILEENQYKIKANLVCGSSSSYTLVYMSDDASTETNTSSNTSSYSQKTSGTSDKTSSTCSTTSNCGSSVNVSTKTNVKQTVIIGNDANKNSTTSNNNTSNNNTSNNNNVKYYTVSFNANGGSYNYSSQNVKAYSTANYPGSNIKNACSFNGWYLNGDKYNFSTPVTSNITLTAKYTCNNYNDYDYDYDYNDDYDYNSYSTKTYTTYVYTMGWDVHGTNYISIDHTLKLPNALNDSDIKNIRIKDINFSSSLTSSTNLTNYYNKHNSTFLYYGNGWESNSHSTSSLSSIRSSAVDFDYNTYWKSRSEARSEGFDVNWTADNIYKQCSKTMSVNGISNLCNYGIVYKVTWQYEERN